MTITGLGFEGGLSSIYLFIFAGGNLRVTVAVACRLGYALGGRDGKGMNDEREGESLNACEKMGYP